MGSIPGQGTKTPHAMICSQKKKNAEFTCVHRMNKEHHTDTHTDSLGISSLSLYGSSRITQERITDQVTDQVV